MTREPKSVDHAPAFEQWRRRADAAELPRPVLGPPAPADRESAVVAVIADLTDVRSSFFITQKDAVIDDRSLRAAIAEAAQGRLGGADIPWLIEHLQASPQLHRVDAQHWTTAATLAIEHEVMARARRARRDHHRRL
jgi:hypothetical protein